MLAVSHDPFACSGGRLPLRRVVWLRRVRCPETACQWWKGLAPNLPVSGKRCAAVPVCRENASQPEHPVPSALQTRVVVLCFGNWKLSDLSNCLWSCCIALPLSLVLLIHVVLQSQRKKNTSASRSQMERKHFLRRNPGPYSGTQSKKCFEIVDFSAQLGLYGVS